MTRRSRLSDSAIRTEDDSMKGQFAWVLALMQDPHDQAKIDQYMQYEFETARQQVAELKQGR